MCIQCLCYMKNYMTVNHQRHGDDDTGVSTLPLIWKCGIMISNEQDCHEELRKYV